MAHLEHRRPTNNVKTIEINKIGIYFLAVFVFQNTMMKKVIH